MRTLILDINNYIIKFVMEKSSWCIQGILQRWVHVESRPCGEMVRVISKRLRSNCPNFQAKTVESVHFHLFNLDIAFLVRKDSQLSTLISFFQENLLRCMGQHDRRLYFLGQNYDSSPESLNIKLGSKWCHLPPESTHISSGFLLKNCAIILSKNSLGKLTSWEAILTETYITVWCSLIGLALSTKGKLTISLSLYSEMGKLSF